MRSEERGLREAICRSPADDDLRMIYADKLDDSSRFVEAELIRLQIKMERAFPREMPGYGPLPQTRKHGRRKAFEKMKAREAELLNSLPHPGWGVSVRYQRGLPILLVCSWAECCLHLDEYLSVNPIESVTLTTEPDDITTSDIVATDGVSFLIAGKNVFVPNECSGRGIGPVLACRWPVIFRPSWVEVPGERLQWEQDGGVPIVYARRGFVVSSETI